MFFRSSTPRASIWVVLRGCRSNGSRDMAVFVRTFYFCQLSKFDFGAPTPYLDYRLPLVQWLGYDDGYLKDSDSVPCYEYYRNHSYDDIMIIGGWEGGKMTRCPFFFKRCYIIFSIDFFFKFGIWSQKRSSGPLAKNIKVATNWASLISCSYVF